MSTSGAQSLPVNLTACEQVLGIPELAQKIIASLHDQPDSLRSVALTNKELSENALRQIWSSKKCGLKDIFQFLPSGKSMEINPEDDHKIIIRDSDNFERLKKYTGYVREFAWGKKDDTTCESVDHLFEAISSHQNLFPNLRALRWTSKSSETQAIFSRFLGPSVVDVQILECPLMDVGEYINILKQRAPGLQGLEMKPFVDNPKYQILLESKPQVTSEDDILFPHLQVLDWTSIPADCHGIFCRLVGPSLVDLRILGCSSDDAMEYAKLISQRAPGLQRLEMKVHRDSDSKHLPKVKPKPKPKIMFQDQVLFLDLRVLRWTSQSSDSQEIFRQLLGPSVLDIHILNSSRADAEEYAETIRRRAHGLQRLEIDLKFCDDLKPLPKLKLDGMHINEFKTNCTLSKEAFFSLATLTHLTSLTLVVPAKGYTEVPGMSCFPSLRSLSLEPHRFDEHCVALVKMVSSGRLDNVSVDVVRDTITTDMLESFVGELVNYPLREFSLTSTYSDIVYNGPLDIAEATLHALQPLLRHRTLASLKIEIDNLRITPQLLFTLGSSCPALEMLFLKTCPSHWPGLDVLFTLAESFPFLKTANIPFTNPSNLLTLSRDWHSPSKLSELHVDDRNQSWFFASKEVRRYIKALFPRADIKFV